MCCTHHHQQDHWELLLRYCQLHTGVGGVGGSIAAPVFLLLASAIVMCDTGGAGVGAAAAGGGGTGGWLVHPGRMLVLCGRFVVAISTALLVSVACGIYRPKTKLGGEGAWASSSSVELPQGAPSSSCCCCMLVLVLLDINLVF